MFETSSSDPVVRTPARRDSCVAGGAFTVNPLDVAYGDGDISVFDNDVFNGSLIFDGEFAANVTANVISTLISTNYDRLFDDVAAPEGTDECAIPIAWGAVATILERRQPSYSSAYREISQATYNLDTSAIATLIRVVDATDYAAESAFVALNASRRQLAAYGWYRRWSEVAAPAVLFAGLTRDGLLDLLRDSRRRRRREHVRRPRVQAAVRRLCGQLERLAHFLSPHAPPVSAHICADAGVASI
jgi:hypothetical protein